MPAAYCGVTVNTILFDGHQHVLGRWRYAALPAGAVGAGGAGDHGQRDATYLNAMVAIGIVVGAGAAAKLVTLDTVGSLHAGRDPDWRCGAFFALQHALLSAYVLLILIGILGGFFVVPLNALLQERGKQTVGAGNAIAVQNLGETWRCC